MADPNAQLPIDDQVRIPEAVKRAAAAADAYFAKAPDQAPPTETPPAEPEKGASGDMPPAEQAPQPAPEPAPPVPTTEEIKTVDYAAEYNSMRGRWRQSQDTINSMQSQMSQMGQELQRLTDALQARQAPPKPLLTPEDEKTYGPELIDMTQRAARAAVLNDIEEVRQRQDELARREQRLQNQTVLNQLDVQLPNWRQVNVDPAFLEWLRLPDVYSGGVRGQMLREAFQAASVPRVLAFFNGYLAEAKATGQLAADPSPAPAQPRTPAVPLATLAAPGRPLPASDNPRIPDKPHFTRAQIAEFYSHRGMQRYIGREADRKADEQLIFEAQREGRITG